MSAEDLKSIVEILSAVLSPDNNLRKEAEKRFETLKNNIPGLIYCLGTILSGKINFFNKI